ncbi:MAG: right-handed parallel beta-helix repeat-containing protein [candidate division WOR-3 bacterium]|nr:right-handed parallel beta-helix repeat-containing protein [candidate division WOR-3 bacterium]
MAKITKIAFAFLLFYGTIIATIWQTPEQFPPHEGCIQRAINYLNVVGGDTISVLQGTPENPEIYYENIIFRGKNITVINRDFLPGGNNDPSTCTIDGSAHTRGDDSASVVTFKDGETGEALLQGFTITNGNGTFYNDVVYYGGGILCVNSSPIITRNRITKNNVTSITFRGRGGGIAIVGENALPKISHNSIDSNYAYYKGGGIAFDYFAAPDIDSNYIYRNGYWESSLTWRGGAISADNENSVDQELGRIYANKIQENVSTHSCAADFYDATPLVRLNEIIENGISQPSDNVINCDASFGSNALPNFGSREDPGLNIFKDNGGEYDLNNGSQSTLTAQGNYWNSLHTPDIRNRIGERIDFDPVAASDRVASVTYNSECETDAIVTGDLTVDEGVTLTIAPGKTFQFFTADVDTNTGDYPTLCELLIKGKLQADGNEDEKISFVPYPPTPVTGGWFGIRLRPYFNTTGNFNNCIIRNGYCGIEASTNSILYVDSSTIESNQVYGISIWQTGIAKITESDIKSNIYGIYSNQASPEITNNRLWNNSRYGILLGNTNTATISENQITCYPPVATPMLYGILLGVVDNGVLIEGNEIERYYSDAGIYCAVEANAQINRNKIMNGQNGILCSRNSNPYVRWCTIDTNKVGVSCENKSYPNLGIVDLAPQPDPGNNSILMGNNIWVANYI